MGKFPGGGVSRQFGTFPKIHPFWYCQTPFNPKIINIHFFFIIIATLDLSDTNLSDNNNMSDSATEGREEVRFLVKEADM